MAILGDSYISGEGAGKGSDPYLPGTDLPDFFSIVGTNKCHRATTSWAAKVATTLTSDKQAGDSTYFVACSGAVTDNVLFRAQFPQSFVDVPGSSAQLVDIKSQQALKPFDLVLASIGGNDAKFADVVQWCMLTPCRYIPSPSSSSPQLLTDAFIQGAQLTDRLAATQLAIAAAAPEAQLWVATYPDPTGTEICLDSGTFNLSNELPSWMRANLDKGGLDVPEQAGYVTTSYRR